MPDELPLNPRDDTNLFRMIFRKKSGLGDQHNYTNEEIRNLIFIKDDEIVYPVFAYERGSISFSLSDDKYPFNDRWDSGQIGVAIANLHDINEWFGWNYKKIENIPYEQRQIIKNELSDELDIYESYVNGNVYYYELSELINNRFEVIDSCGGFYGIGKDVKNQMAEQLGDASYLLDRLY
jgi:hypothetical protein